MDPTYYAIPISNLFQILESKEPFEEVQHDSWQQVKTKKKPKQFSTASKTSTVYDKSNEELVDFEIAPNYTNSKTFDKTKNGKTKCFIFGDSQIKRLNKHLFNNPLKNHHAILKNFDGANAKYIRHHMLPFLQDNDIETIIIHAGTNDI